MTDTPLEMPPPTSSLRPKLPGEQTSSDVAEYPVEGPLGAVNLEDWVGLGLLILVGGVFLATRLASGSENSAKFEHAVRRDQTPQRPKSSKPAPRQPQKQFDAKTAKHVPAKKIVQGKAWVTDGDTIIINKTQVRLFGIDAPEIDHPFGQKAKWAMVKLCKGHVVKAVVTDIDHFGRTVAHCTLPDGRDLSAELVKMGLATDWPKYSGGKYAHLEAAGVRKKLWLADARQQGRMYLWEQFQYDQRHLKKR